MRNLQPVLFGSGLAFSTRRTDASFAADQAVDGRLAGVLDKAQFWQRWAGTPMNPRQTLVLNRVLDGMEGKLTNAKWAAMGKCSADTALHDINNLLARGVLRRLEGGGRSTGYGLVRYGC